MPRRFRILVWTSLVLAVLVPALRGDAFSDIAADGRLSDVYRSLSGSKFTIAQPTDVEGSLAAQVLRGAYDGERHAFFAGLAVVPEGERDPVTLVDLAVVDRQAGDRVVALVEIHLPRPGPAMDGAAREARSRLQAMRTMLLLHGEQVLQFKDPQKKWAVRGVLRPGDAPPALLALGPRGAAALGFDRVLPIDRAERDLLFRALLFRDHMADAAHIAASPLLTRYLQVLLAADVDYKAIGQVLEILVHDHLRRTRYPEGDFWVGGGLEYKYSEEGQTVGELDILALRLADRKMVFIGECKLSSPAMFAERLKKARSQLQRIRETLEAPEAQSLVFTYLPEPEKPFAIDMFQDVDITYEVYGNSQATEFGFDHEIELDRGDGDVLFREAQYQQRGALPFLELVSFGGCRRLLQAREAAARAQRAEDAAAGVAYGDRREACEASWPAACRILADAEDFEEALNRLVDSGLDWASITELFRGHPDGLRLVESFEAPHVAALLVREDAPPHLQALILAVHPQLNGGN